MGHHPCARGLHTCARTHTHGQGDTIRASAIILLEQQVSLSIISVDNIYDCRMSENLYMKVNTLNRRDNFGKHEVRLSSWQRRAKD